MHVRTSLTAAALLACFPALVAADDVVSLRPGSKVRVTVVSKERPLTGQVLALDDDSLTLEVGREARSMSVRRTEIRRLDVSTGHQSRRRNALIGALVGGGAGGILGGIAGRGYVDAGTVTLRGVALGAPIGALVGARVRPADRWRSVPLDRIQIAARRQDGHTSVALTWAF